MRAEHGSIDSPRTGKTVTKVKRAELNVTVRTAALPTTSMGRFGCGPVAATLISVRHCLDRGEWVTQLSVEVGEGQLRRGLQIVKPRPSTARCGNATAGRRFR